MLREEAVGRPHTHRPRHETKLPIGVEVKVELIIPIVPEDEEIIALLPSLMLYGHGAKRPAIEVQDEPAGRGGG